MADTYTPPKDVQDAAARGLELRRQHGHGGMAIGVARARDLSNGRAVSLNTVKRMASFFTRNDHHGDYRKDETSAAAIHWLLWGGDPGREWATDVLGKVGKGWSEAWGGRLSALAKAAPDVGDVHQAGAIGNAQPGAAQGAKKPTDVDAEELAEDAEDESKAAQVKLVAKLADTDEEQRIAYYVASVAEEADGAVVVDRQQDMISAEELEQTAHNFLLNYRRIGDRHERWGGIGEVVASFVTTRELQKSLGSLPGSEPVKLPVAWVMGIHITDEAIWAEVKNGTLEAMSIGGSAVRVEAA